MTTSAIGMSLPYLGIVACLMMLEGTVAFKTDCNESYCFVLSSEYEERRSQSYAREWCRLNGSLLVEIVNSSVQNAVANAYYRSSSFLNNWNIITNGKRANINNWIRLDGGGIDRISITYDQNYQSSYFAYLRPTASQINVAASGGTEGRSFICSADNTNCSNGVMIGGQCHIVYNSQSHGLLSWYDARNRCLDGGGDLTSITFITSNAGFSSLKGALSLNPSNTYWIGIRRDGWTWQNSNSDVGYSQWQTDHPVYGYGDCICFSPYSRKWIECSCYERVHFMCISGKPTSVYPSIDPSTTSTTYTSASTTLPSVLVSTPQTSKNTRNDTDTSRSPPAPGIVPVATTNQGPRDTEAIGIGVGVGAGVILIATAVVFAVIIARKRCLSAGKCPRAKQEFQPPDVILQSPSIASQPPAVVDHYSVVTRRGLPAVDNDPVDGVDQTNGKSGIVYADLDFLPHVLSSNSPITIYANAQQMHSASSSSQPSEDGTAAAADAVNRFQINGDEYAMVTKA